MITKVISLAGGNDPRKWKILIMQERRKTEHAEFLGRKKADGLAEHKRDVPLKGKEKLS